MKTPAANFKSDVGRVAVDLRHRSLIQTALGKYEVARDARKSAFQDWQGARQAAAETKWEAINNLDEYLESSSPSWSRAAQKFIGPALVRRRVKSSSAYSSRRTPAPSATVFRRRRCDGFAAGDAAREKNVGGLGATMVATGRGIVCRTR